MRAAVRLAIVYLQPKWARTAGKALIGMEVDAIIVGCSDGSTSSRGRLHRFALKQRLTIVVVAPMGMPSLVLRATTSSLLGCHIELVLGTPEGIASSGPDTAHWLEGHRKPLANDWHCWSLVPLPVSSTTTPFSGRP
eukprot:GILK01028074.1.p2 GENE.GILK01028074.1~~GILK01028074.1.p2  ORF type:complete len:137 (-),score=3.71 GILK01028074.1:62-472(-)